MLQGVCCQQFEKVEYTSRKKVNINTESDRNGNLNFMKLLKIDSQGRNRKLYLPSE